MEHQSWPGKLLTSGRSGTKNVAMVTKIVQLISRKQKILELGCTEVVAFQDILHQMEI